MKSLIIGGHGIGDCILALQCAHAASNLSNEKFDLKMATRDEVFEPLKYFFKDHFELEQIPEEFGTNNSILSSNNYYILNLLEKYRHIYYVIPDLLFNSPYAFDFKTYRLSPHVIKTVRLSLDQWMPTQKIYVGLVTMADHHRYKSIHPLLKNLARTFPTYEIYFPNVKNWGGANLDWGDLDDMPENVFIHENPKFEDSIDHLKQSCFGIFADNGPSHFAYHLGMPRIVLDNFIGNPQWLARWREDPSESVSMNTNVLDLVSIVKAHILCPQSSLIPKEMCKTSLGMGELLGFKY